MATDFDALFADEPPMDHTAEIKAIKKQLEILEVKVDTIIEVDSGMAIRVNRVLNHLGYR